MCLVLYIGSDAICPLLEPQDFSVINCDDPAWTSKVVPFSVEEIAGDAKAVEKHFDTQFVQYAGSFEGCGCGFNASYSPEWDDPPEENDHFLAGRESRRLLRDFVEKHEVRQIFACWSGDEGLDAESHLDITSDQITDPNFQFPERAMLRITKSE